MLYLYAGTGTREVGFKRRAAEVGDGRNGGGGGARCSDWGTWRVRSGDREGGAVHGGVKRGRAGHRARCTHHHGDR